MPCSWWAAKCLQGAVLQLSGRKTSYRRVRIAGVNLLQVKLVITFANMVVVPSLQRQETRRVWQQNALVFLKRLADFLPAVWTVWAVSPMRGMDAWRHFILTCCPTQHPLAVLLLEPGAVPHHLHFTCPAAAAMLDDARAGHVHPYGRKPHCTELLRMFAKAG